MKKSLRAISKVIYKGVLKNNGGFSGCKIPARIHGGISLVMLREFWKTSKEFHKISMEEF